MAIVTSLFIDPTEAASALEALRKSEIPFGRSLLVAGGPRAADRQADGAFLSVVTGALPETRATGRPRGPLARMLGGLDPHASHPQIAAALRRVGVPADEADEAQAAVDVGFVVAVLEVPMEHARALRERLRARSRGLAASLRDTLPDTAPFPPDEGPTDVIGHRPTLD